jgi:hypothetical protein
MKTGDKIKAFVQVGLMRKPRWILGTLVEENVVQVSGNKVCLERGKIKLWQPLEYVDGRWPKFDSFREENWKDLKKIVTESVERYFPGEHIRIDDEEKIIYVNEDLSVGPGVKEMETIAAFREIPVWTVTHFRGIAATRWEPADVEEVNCGDSSTTIGAARILVDNLWKFHTEGYWESLEESRYCGMEDNGN